MLQSVILICNGGVENSILIFSPFPFIARSILLICNSGVENSILIFSPFPFIARSILQGNNYLILAHRLLQNSTMVVFSCAAFRQDSKEILTE